MTDRRAAEVPRRRSARDRANPLRRNRELARRGQHGLRNTPVVRRKNGERRSPETEHLLYPVIGRGAWGDTAPANGIPPDGGVSVACVSLRMATAAKKIPVSGGARAQMGRKNPRAKIAVPGNRGIKVVRAVTIRKPASELYAFWRELPNLMRVINHPVSITTTAPDESHWVVSAPAGRRVEWDAVIVNDNPNRLIAWRSGDGAEVENAGSVRFEDAPGDEGIEVTVALEYNPPGGKLGAAIAKLTRDTAGSQVYDALRRFKALMEAGEIPTIEGQSVGGPQRPRKGKK
jgi:uncharacterized membrane protein